MTDLTLKHDLQRRINLKTFIALHSFSLVPTFDNSLQCGGISNFWVPCSVQIDLYKHYSDVAYP